ncbi:hypothetical protein [Intestinibacillus massiliensis]|uniref:hypothetical protein n=1 Tax=Intestinibacillus massiliensis TaxID=1871029 RepID=UPI000B3648DC|nr:hypothetical protein [Intestinibacillus massiliensis]
MPITGQIHPVYDAEGNAFFPQTVDGAVIVGDTTLAAKAQGWDAEKPEREAADAALGNRLAANEALTQQVWDAMFLDVTRNPWSVTFVDQQGYTLVSGVWNAAKQRLEC